MTTKLLTDDEIKKLSDYPYGLISMAASLDYYTQELENLLNINQKINYWLENTEIGKSALIEIQQKIGNLYTLSDQVRNISDATATLIEESKNQNKQQL